MNTKKFDNVTALMSALSKIKEVTDVNVFTSVEVVYIPNNTAIKAVSDHIIATHNVRVFAYTRRKDIVGISNKIYAGYVVTRKDNRIKVILFKQRHRK